jgi:hypothetical protein
MRAKSLGGEPGHLLFTVDYLKVLAGFGAHDSKVD